MGTGMYNLGSNKEVIGNFRAATTTLLIKGPKVKSTGHHNQISFRKYFIIYIRLKFEFRIFHLFILRMKFLTIKIFVKKNIMIKLQ
jgi:hypothetical protein